MDPRGPCTWMLRGVPQARPSNPGPHPALSSSLGADALAYSPDSPFSCPEPREPEARPGPHALSTSGYVPGYYCWDLLWPLKYTASADPASLLCPERPDSKTIQPSLGTMSSILWSHSIQTMLPPLSPKSPLDKFNPLAPAVQSILTKCVSLTAPWPSLPGHHDVQAQQDTRVGSVQHPLLKIPTQL